MKKTWLAITLLVVLLFVFPLLVITKTQQTADLEVELEYCPFEITVEGVDEPVPLEEYVKGVVAAEMPVAFHEEALKAQALAARTYALKSTKNGAEPIAKGVSAQVYYTEAERKKNWGKEAAENEKKIDAAVQATTGEVIIYGEELISAMFFSTSNGQTETAKNFSGTDIPYLQSVDSGGEENLATAYKEEKKIPLAKWNEAIGSNWNANMFESLQLVRNSSGRVQKMLTDGFEKEGREVRELLGLRSTDFNIAFDVTNELILVNTVGYGHGVGMSQYGAEAFAQAGSNAYDIIGHYYTETTVKKILKDDPLCLKPS